MASLGFRSVIGEALVRITPDTRGFRTETQRGVTAALGGPTGAGAGLSSARAAGITGLLVVTALGLRAAFNEARESSVELNAEVDRLNTETEELKARIVGELTPAFVGFVDRLADGAGAVNDLADALNRFAQTDITGGFSVGDLFDVSALDISDKIVRSLDNRFINTFEEKGGEAGEAFAEGLRAKIAIETGQAGRANLFSPEGLNAKNAIEEWRATGASVGSSYIDFAERELISGQIEVVNAARSTLQAVIRAGNAEIRDAIRQGNEAVRLSAIEARSNLVFLGQSLATDALILLEEGPLARRIDALRASLDRAQSRTQRRGLRQGLRDAEFALRDAERNIQTAGPPTAAQAAARSRLLEPFRRGVLDAKDALSQFNTESVIEQLEKQADTQRQVVEQGIADVISEFNRGAVNVAQANQRIASLLEREGVKPFGVAGKALGVAFVTKFSDELDAIRRQMIEIARGPDVAAGIDVVSPAAVERRRNETVAQARERAAATERDARKSLVTAQNDLRDVVLDNTGSLDAATAAVTGLAKALRGVRPRVSVGEGTTVNP